MAGPTEYSRKTFVLAGVVMLVLLFLGALAAGFYVDANDTPMGGAETATIDDAPAPKGAPAPPAGATKPSSLPRPADGRAPEEDGDPGGWQQIALFGLLAASMLGIGAAIFVGSRRTRANKAAWLAAAEPGQEDLRRFHAPT